MEKKHIEFSVRRTDTVQTCRALDDAAGALARFAGANRLQMAVGIIEMNNNQVLC